MAEPLAIIRKRAEKLEIELLAIVAAAADLIVPPFPAKLRQRICDALGKAQFLQVQLHDTWRQQLHSPEAKALVHYSPDRLFFAALHRRLNLWFECHALLRQVLNTPALPIIAKAPASDSPTGLQLFSYQGAFYRLHDYLSPPRPNPEDYIGRHNDIPLQFTLFVRLMQLARRSARALGTQGPLSFLDVGCGVGLKVLQATQFFEIAQGLEYDGTRSVVADRLVHHPRRVKDRAFQADALEYDGYGGFDVIYAYKPLSSVELLMQMEARIIAQARPGTVLVMPYAEFEGRHQAYGCGQVDDLVYVTGYGGRDMKPLLRKIARIGFIVPEDPALRGDSEGFVAPLANALRRWGHMA